MTHNFATEAPFHVPVDFWVTTWGEPLNKYFTWEEVFPLLAPSVVIREGESKDMGGLGLDRLGFNRKIFVRNVLQDLVKEKITFHPNGRKQAQWTEKGGQKYGLKQEWYDNGQLKNQTKWINDEKDGLELEWYRNGRKSSYQSCSKPSRFPFFHVCSDDFRPFLYHSSSNPSFSSFIHFV